MKSLPAEYERVLCTSGNCLSRSPDSGRQKPCPLPEMCPWLSSRGRRGSSQAPLVQPFWGHSRGLITNTTFSSLLFQHWQCTQANFTTWQNKHDWVSCQNQTFSISLAWMAFSHFSNIVGLRAFWRAAKSNGLSHWPWKNILCSLHINGNLGN